MKAVAIATTASIFYLCSPIAFLAEERTTKSLCRATSGKAAGRIVLRHELRLLVLFHNNLIRLSVLAAFCFPHIRCSNRIGGLIKIRLSLTNHSKRSF